MNVPRASLRRRLVACLTGQLDEIRVRRAFWRWADAERRVGHFRENKVSMREADASRALYAEAVRAQLRAKHLRLFAEAALLVGLAALLRS